MCAGWETLLTNSSELRQGSLMTGQLIVERGVTSRGEAISAPGFVGREQELVALDHALANGPAVVLIEGEAGIGKSALLREYFTASGAGEQALVAGCPPFRQPHTLGSVADAVRQATDGVSGLSLSALAGALRPLFPEWGGELPAIPEAAQDPTAARHRLFGALAELVGRLQVTLLAVEDAQWADEATIEFLLFLAAQQHQRISLVVTYRPEDVPAGSLLLRLSSRRPASATQLRLALGPLDRAATARMVASMLGMERIPGGFAAFMHESTEGVPLAVEELVRLLGDRADLACQDGTWVHRHLDEIDVPPMIRDAVLERIERLAGDIQAILRAAAVLIYPADEAALVAVSGLPLAQGRTGLAGALQCGLLAENGRGHLSFRHVLASRAVYERIPGPERRVMHLRAGQVLEKRAPRPVAWLASHFREAGEIREWCQYAEQAADLAIETGDVVTAIGLLRDLLAKTQLDVRSVIRLADKIPGPAFTGDPRLQDVVHALRSHLDVGIPDPAEAAEVRFQLGEVLFLMEEFETARSELERAAPGLSHKPVYAVRAMLMLSWPRGPGRVSVHARWLRRAAKFTPSIGPVDRLRMTVDRATGLLLLGDSAGWAEAAQIPEHAVTSQEMWEITRGNLNIGHTAMMWGRYAEAGRRLARALELASGHQYWRYHAMALGTQAHLEWLTGAWHGLSERAASLAHSENMPPISRLEPRLVTAQLQAVAGRHAEARDRLHRMCEETQRPGIEAESLGPAAALARLLLADGDPGGALQITDWPINVVADKGTWLWATDLAPARITALVAAGRVEQAAELARRFARGLRGCDAPGPRAGLALCRAVLAHAYGHHDRAARLFACAAAAWEVLPRPYDTLLAKERQAECLLAGGQSDSALTQMSEARQGFAGLGATADAERVARCLRKHGVAVPRGQRGGRRGYGDQLSPREVEVVRLVIAGHTNREIAGLLCRSPDTVATQLKSAMRKLHVSSRAAVAATAVAAGISADPRRRQGE
jgi:DNA-binding CsgD family transcriptional regulator/tetratricopeptide (TPR) repeat protein